MASKTLDSILSKFPSATVNENNIIKENLERDTVAKKTEPTERIVAVIPYYLKREIRQYLVNNPEDTERTVILKGLKAIGFKVKHEELEDKRGRKI